MTLLLRNVNFGSGLNFLIGAHVEPSYYRVLRTLFCSVSVLFFLLSTHSKNSAFDFRFYSVCVCVCVCVCVFIKLHITTQSGPVILVILCHSQCVCVYLLNCT